MGRSEKRRRTKLVALRVFPEELEILKDAAFAARMSMSKFLRVSALDAAIPPAGKHAATGVHEARPAYGADERYADDLYAMSGDLHPELSDEDTQEIAADSLFERTQDANDYAAHERLMDGVEQ